MQANDLPTVGYLDKWFQALYAQGRAQPAGEPGAAVVLYSAAKLAQVLDVSVETVRRWLKTGKRGRNGQPIRLQAYYFTSEPRIPWPAALAYHRGEDFDLDTLPAPLLVPEVVPVAAPPTLTPPQEPPVMRVA